MAKTRQYKPGSYASRVVLLEWGVLQHMKITLDGLIWDLDIFNYEFGYV